MADYGVIPTGFNRKPLTVILQEIETSNQTELGSGVIQTPQSPLGQLNGLMADLIAQLWEFAETTYNSHDPDAAEGNNLDRLAKLRLLRRAAQEQDEGFRRAITNQGQARIDLQDITRAVAGLDGVTYVQVFLNDGDAVDANGIPRGSIAVAVLGGNDEELAEVLRQYIVPGISTFGNVPIISNEEGFCRSMMIMRPLLIPVKLTVHVKLRKDVMGCPPPSLIAIRDTLVQRLNAGDRRLLNGDDVDEYRIRSIVESEFQSVQFNTFSGERDGHAYFANQPVPINFMEKAEITTENVDVRPA